MKLFLLTFVFIINLFGQNNYSTKQFWKDTGNYYNILGRWDKNDLQKAFLITGTTIGLMTFDEKINKCLRSDAWKEKEFVSETGRLWGEPWINVAITAGFLINGHLLKNESSRKIGTQLLQSELCLLPFLGVLKYSIGRARPLMNEGVASYKFFSFDENSYASLPSGHTMFAFSLSTIFAENINSNYLKALVYLPAFLTAYSRMNDNYHWLSDVFLGGCIGYFTAKYIIDRQNEFEQNIPLEPTPIISFSIGF